MGAGALAIVSIVGFLELVLNGAAEAVGGVRRALTGQASDRSFVRGAIRLALAVVVFLLPFRAVERVEEQNAWVDDDGNDLLDPHADGPWTWADVNGRDFVVTWAMGAGIVLVVAATTYRPSRWRLPSLRGRARGARRPKPVPVREPRPPRRRRGRARSPRPVLPAPPRPPDYDPIPAYGRHAGRSGDAWPSPTSSPDPSSAAPPATPSPAPSGDTWVPPTPERPAPAAAPATPVAPASGDAWAPPATTPSPAPEPAPASGDSWTPPTTTPAPAPEPAPSSPPEPAPSSAPEPDPGTVAPAAPAVDPLAEFLPASAPTASPAPEPDVEPAPEPGPTPEGAAEPGGETGDDEAEVFPPSEPVVLRSQRGDRSTGTDGDDRS